MKLVIISFWLFIYSFGIVCLPLGDFSLLKDLPAMYQHCKATEDPGLGVLEFLVEHVSGVGQIMEGIEHENELDEDGDKPHAPIYPTPTVTYIYYTTPFFTAPKASKILPICNEFPIYKKAIYTLAINTSVFRPPIA